MNKTIPNGWRTIKISDVATVFSGGTPDRTNPDFYKGTNPWVKSGEINSRIIRNTEEHISDSAIEQSSAKWVPAGAVLVAMYGATAGKVAKLMIDATLNQAISAVMVKDKNSCNDYLFHALDFNGEELLKSLQGSGQPNLSGGLIKGLKILHPPLPEQQKIAAILTSVDDVIETTQAQINKLKDLKTGMMQELLTKGIGHTEFKDSPVGRIPKAWKVLKLSSLVKPNKQITYGIVQTGPHIENGVPCVRVVDLMKDELSTDNMIRTTIEVSEQFKRTILAGGDILFALRGEIGHVRLVDENLVGANLTRGVALISPNEKVSSEFLLWAIRSAGVRQNILDRVNGSALQEIPLGNLREVDIPIPLEKEQETIATLLGAVEHQINKKLSVLSAQQRLKKALMQDLLTGKVRVKVN